METFYTIVKIAPNTLAGESLAIGLLLRDASGYRLHFSADKKSLARQLLNTKADIVDFAVRQIEGTVADFNALIKRSNNALFPLNEMLGSERVSHLNVYCNGILRFSEPAFLNDTVDDEKFIKLFQLLVDKTYSKAKPDIDPNAAAFHDTIPHKLINRVNNRVHTNIELTPEKLPGLYFNINIEVLGLNGSFIGAKAIPFYKKNDTIDRELSHYFSLISTLNLKFPHRKTTTDRFFIIGDEPADVSSREHRTWENIKNNPVVTLINADESAIVAEEIEDSEATKFLV